MRLIDRMDEMKQELAACNDVEDAMALYAECREAEAQMAQLTTLAAAVAERVSRRTVPATGGQR